MSYDGRPWLGTLLSAWQPPDPTSYFYPRQKFGGIPVTTSFAHGIVLTCVALGTAFSIEGWFKSSSSNSPQRILETADWTLSLVAGILTYVGGAVTVTGGTLNDGNYHHFAVTYDGTNTRLYVDGALVGGPSLATINATATTMFVATTSTGASPFIGSFGNLATYQYAMSANQVANHYGLRTSTVVKTSAALAADNSNPSGRSDLPGTAQKNVLFQQTGPMSDLATAAIFNGATATPIPVIVISPPATTTTCTIEFWMRMDGNSGDGFLTVLCDSGATHIVGVYFSGAHAGHLSVFFGGVDHFNTSVLSSGTWYHVAISISAGSGTFYLNGVADGTFTSYTSATFTKLGASTSANETFNGALADVALYLYALSSTQISNHYAARTGTTSMALVSANVENRVDIARTGFSVIS